MKQGKRDSDAGWRISRDQDLRFTSLSCSRRVAKRKGLLNEDGMVWQWRILEALRTT
jgi:hypothetical protein